jgi:menaquinone-specific isochorismate synthase
MTDTVPVGTRRTGISVRADTARKAACRVVLPSGSAIDPFALAGDNRILMADAGRILVGVGTAMTLSLPDGLADQFGVDRVVADLAALECDDRLPPGTSALRAVLAFGALPFDRSAPAALVVPATLYCREPDGTEWVTVVDGPRESPDQVRERLVAIATSHRPGDSGPMGTRVVPRSDDASFEGAVAAAVDAIGRGELTKVVLARRIDVILDRSPDLAALLRRWSALEPSGTLFSRPSPAGQFVGASPELLVERTGRHVRSRPLAGTTDRFPVSSSPLPSELLESAKDTEEHRLVVDAIRNALAPWCSDLTVPDRPELVHLHNLTHLGTIIDGTLQDDSMRVPPSALHLAALLHPTPAVGGVPRAAALDLIARLEEGPRGPYAGPVGYLDGKGDGRFVVGIRAMTVAGRTATLTAGVGVVSGSHPKTERDEAELKFMAVFDALAPGVPFDTSG